MVNGMSLCLAGDKNLFSVLSWKQVGGYLRAKRAKLNHPLRSGLLHYPSLGSTFAASSPREAGVQYHAFPIRWSVLLESYQIKDLLKLENFHSPVALDQTSRETGEIALVLESFALVQQYVNPKPGLEIFFQAPVLWFAVLIYSCCADINRTLGYLITPQILGKFDQVHFQGIRSVITYNSDHKTAEVLSWKPAEKLHAYGFWLPQTYSTTVNPGTPLVTHNVSAQEAILWFASFDIIDC